MANFSDLTIRRPTAVRFACALAAVLGATNGAALAQSANSRPVVQQLPPASLGELNAALKDLARDPGNVPALVRAGWASLGLDDTQSALGFFRRAAAIQPQNGEVKAGLATSSLRGGDALAAMRQFDEAQAAGAPMIRYAGDRGLALDLVGNNAAAQQFYRQALTLRSDPEIIRRLALSQAIAGDQKATEATLLPLLQSRDLASFRTRAFALAILGKGEEAVSIAQTMLPAQISSRMAPYLRYMPRLTRAQQAAAANLGQFPPAYEIGHDNPQIAAISAAAAPKVALAGADDRLVPKGAPLGRTSSKTASSTRADNRSSKPPKAAAKGGNFSVTYTPLAQAAPPPPTPPPAAMPPVQRVAAAVQSQASAPQFTPPVQTYAAATPTPASSPVAQNVATLAQPSTSQPAVTNTAIASFEPTASSASPSLAVDDAPKPSLSIGPAAPQAKEAGSLADAFADFAKLPATAKAPPEAVDISKITPAREAPKVEPAKREPVKAKPEPVKAKPKPKPPANPQRFWAQVATGRDVKALGFDWRRLQREGGALLAKQNAFTAKWGQTRRLLAGPYKSEDEADKAVAALKKKGIDAFEFTSDEGQEVTPLK